MASKKKDDVQYEPADDRKRQMLTNQLEHQRTTLLELELNLGMLQAQYPDAKTDTKIQVLANGNMVHAKYGDRVKLMKQGIQNARRSIEYLSRELAKIPEPEPEEVEEV